MTGTGCPVGAGLALPEKEGAESGAPMLGRNGVSVRA